MASKIGELLVKNGIISEAQLNEALRQQKVQGKKLGEILLELQYLTSRDLVCMLSEQFALPFVELKPEMLDAGLIQKFPETLLYELCALPLYETEQNIYFAVGDPTHAVSAELLARHTSKKIIISGADPKKILLLLDEIFLSQGAEAVIAQMAGGQEIMLEINDRAAILETTGRDGQQTRQQITASVFIKLKRQETKDDHESD